MSRTHHIIPIFVPHRGCPHDCVFCNQKKITGLSTDITPNKVENIIKNCIKTIPKTNQLLEIAFFGGSFTGIKPEIQKQFLQIAKKYKEAGIVNKIRLSTRPDYIDCDILDLLKNNGVDIIELGVQSLDDDVLKKSFRGHSSDDVINAVKMIKEYNFTLGLQMMVGLPNDTKQKSVCTALNIAKLKPNFVRIYPTLVIKETFLEKLYIKGEYESLSIEKAVDICSDLLMIFEYYGINVIRIGLQATDNISLEKDVVAGPYHPAFRQLVEGEIYRRILDQYFSKTRKVSGKINIKINRFEIDKLVGQKSVNTRFIKDKYNIIEVSIGKDNIPKDYFLIKSYNGFERIERYKYIEDYLSSNRIVDCEK